MEVLVTGGLGFIGSHVTDAYLAKGHRVTVVDSTVASVTSGQEYDDHPDAQVVREPVEKYFLRGDSLAGIDRVIHAAAHVGPAGILRYAGRLGADIVNSTADVLDACQAEGVPVCVFSSAEVYGRSGRLGERDDIRVPTRYTVRTEYAVAKTLTEAMVANRRHFGLRGVVVRPFNVAGPRQSRAGGFVMPTFVQQALAGLPLTVFASGQQVRAFLSVSDLARFVVDHLDAALASREVIYNLGSPANSTTVWDLAERIKELLASDSPIVHADARAIHGPLYEEAESFEKVPVLGAATEVGWAPRADLDALILETADHYRFARDVRGASAPL